MEKNRIRPVKSGKSMRMSYSRQKEVLEMPNLIEVQKDSYQWFLNEGLKEVFSDISPIADYNGRPVSYTHLVSPMLERLISLAILFCILLVVSELSTLNWNSYITSLIDKSKEYSPGFICFERGCR